MPSNRASAGHVAVVGTLNIDLVWQVPELPRPGRTILASAVERQFGGKGANQAVAAARQGARVTLLGAVGDDVEGRQYRENLARAGVGVDFVAIIANMSTGTAHVYVDPRGENLIVVDRGANGRLDVAELGRVLPGTDVLLVQLECALAVAVEALRRAAELGVRSVLNASPTNPAFPWAEHEIDTVIVNQHECGECFEHTPIELWSLPVEARRALLAARKVRHIVVTQGAEPTLHLSAEASHAAPTFRVRPLDTVGAGDTCAGTLAAQLASGVDWEPALWHANVAAALSTLEIGAQSAMPTREAVMAAIGAEKQLRG